jgi:hypothetical protein
MGRPPDGAPAPRAQDADIKAMPVAAAPKDGAGPASREDPMSAATRSTQATPDMRQAFVAVGALTLAVAFAVAVAVSQPSITRPGTGAGAAAAPVVHDHGWSTAQAAPEALTSRGPGGGALNYTGIPYPAPESNATGGGNGTRLAQ